MRHFFERFLVEQEKELLRLLHEVQKENNVLHIVRERLLHLEFRCSSKEYSILISQPENKKPMYQACQTKIREVHVVYKLRFGEIRLNASKDINLLRSHQNGSIFGYQWQCIPSQPRLTLPGLLALQFRSRSDYTITMVLKEVDSDSKYHIPEPT